ncbi:MAG: metallophosphoesterase [Oscillospiraceae bacterium]|nr:metallophosphoesterase [Oscillospiraceae bacterium]
MAIYTIADLHLSLGVSKPMDVFEGWDNYVERLTSNWNRTVADSDSVIIPGDISWAMNFDELKDDFAFIHSLPGIKYLLKGNHDYWWNTRTKVENLIRENGWDSIKIIQNDSVKIDGIAVCGTRGWVFSENPTAEDARVFNRELLRLRMSLDSAVKQEAGEIIVFLHYPPIYSNFRAEALIDILLEFGVRRCYYGHVHGNSIPYSFAGTYKGIEFRLVSADNLQFRPLLVE